MKPLISICIPAYKNAEYLGELMHSISVQTFTDYEVIVSDDSPGNEVESLCEKYNALFPLRYKKNVPAKGSPANWNEGIRMANGQWIKMMHDDDWFANENSLEIFAKAAQDNPQVGFIFSGYTNYENGEIKKTNIPGLSTEKKLKNPLHLIYKNLIGHPSTTLIKNDRAGWYDERTKWVVDIEFYIRCLQNSSFYIIHESLINIGINNEQITKTAFRNGSVEIPEYLYLLEKMGEGILKNIFVYDHYWRLLRNLNIRNIEQIESYAGKVPIPGKIRKMLKMQSAFPLSLLRVGAFSKVLMAASFYTN